MSSIIGPRKSYTVSIRPSADPKRATMASETASWPEPPKGFTRTLHSTDRDLALQDYLSLQEEHESLRQHLDFLRTSCTSNPATSPVQAMHPRDRSRAQRRRSSGMSVALRPVSCVASSGSALDTVLDESTIAEMEAEEARLGDVNEGIKRALTELLNCSTVRTDGAFRMWVQCRLMDTERALRTGRRRRSAPEFCMPSYQ